MKEYRKPLPEILPENRTFWEGCKRHELLIQKCAKCSKYRFFPSPYCPDCMSDSVEWVISSGRGKIYSFTIQYRAPSEVFKEDIPYAIAIIELEEGVRMMGTLTGCNLQDLAVGMPVHVIFDDVTERISLPRFGLLPSGANTEAIER